MEEIKYSSYSSNNIKVALLLPFILIPIAFILIVLKANLIANGVALMFSIFLISLITGTLLIQNLLEREDVVFLHNRLIIFLRKAPYLNTRWGDFSKVEILKEYYKRFYRHSGTVIRKTHCIKFHFNYEVLEYRLWWEYFSEEKQKRIISTLTEFLESKNIPYKVQTDIEEHSDDDSHSLLQQHYHTKVLCKEEHYGDRTWYQYRG